jgi:hypothetical protein
MNKYVSAFIDRFSQESTWRGLTAILMAFGVTLKPDQMEAIVSVGLLIIGTINVAKNK